LTKKKSRKEIQTELEELQKKYHFQLTARTDLEHKMERMSILMVDILEEMNQLKKSNTELRKKLSEKKVVELDFIEDPNSKLDKLLEHDFVHSSRNRISSVVLNVDPVSWNTSNSHSNVTVGVEKVRKKSFSDKKSFFGKIKKNM
jgi:hypothetical protein